MVPIIKIVGIEAKDGVSTKTNKPYSIRIVHCVHDEVKEDGLRGVKVETMFLPKTFDIGKIQLNGRYRPIYEKTGNYFNLGDLEPVR